MLAGEKSPVQEAPEDPYLKDKARREQAAIKARGDSPENLLRIMRDKVRARGARGIIGLLKLFKMMDDDGSMTLSLPEFEKLCKDFKLGITEENVPILFSKFDRS